MSICGAGRGAIDPCGARGPAGSARTVLVLETPTPGVGEKERYLLLYIYNIYFSQTQIPQMTWGYSGPYDENQYQ